MFSMDILSGIIFIMHITLCSSHTIISALGYGGWGVANCIHIVKEIVLLWKPTSMDKVVIKNEIQISKQVDQQT